MPPLPCPALVRLPYVAWTASTLAREVQRARMSVSPIIHLQAVFALVALRGAENVHPQLLHAASGQGSLVLVNPLLPDAKAE